MKKKYQLLAVSAAMAGAFAAPAFAEGVEFHGYLRTGLGGTSEGGSQQCFHGNFPIRSKFRLGNECDTYGEVQLDAPFGNKDGAWGKYTLMLALQGGDQGDYVNTDQSLVKNGAGTVTDINASKFTIANRQNFFQFGGVFGGGAMKDAKAWIGKRYYNRHDIHITDYFYWNNSGQGAGIEDIDVGPVKLAFATHQTDGYATAASSVISRRYSARAYGLAVNPGGTLEGEFVYLKDSTASSAPTGDGTMLFLEHTQGGLLGGFNKLAFIWGNKQGSGFEWLPTYPSTGPASGNSFRIHDQLYFNLAGTNISGMATASYAKSDCCGGDQKWYNIGVRPQYNFSDTFSLAGELGYDQGQSGSAPAAKITKLTIAPQLSLTRGFWARPVLRAFLTYADWNSANGDAGTNGVFGTKTSGMSYGVQVEAWW